jgi:Ni,Fe-hydrogenase III small subunit
VLPARPDDGATVTHIPPLKVVVAMVAAGSNVTLASGTDSVKFALVIVCPVKRIVTGVEPRPLGLSTALNQI